MARLRGDDGHTATPDQVDPQAGRGSAPCPRRPGHTPSRRAGIGQPLRRSMVAWATGSGLSALPGSSSFDVWRRNIRHLDRRKNRYGQSPQEISKPFYPPFLAVRSDVSSAELKKQRQAEIERMIETKVAEAIRRLLPTNSQPTVDSPPPFKSVP